MYFIFPPVALVRLLRIEEGGAFADVLAGEGDDSWDDEIMYLERTLGFRTSPLDARDFRQVKKIATIIIISLKLRSFDKSYFLP